MASSLWYLGQAGPNSCVGCHHCRHNSWSTKPTCLALIKIFSEIHYSFLVIVYSREFLHCWWHSDTPTCPLCPPGDLCGHQCGVGCGCQWLKGEGCSSPRMPSVYQTVQCHSFCCVLLFQRELASSGLSTRQLMLMDHQSHCMRLTSIASF